MRTLARILFFCLLVILVAAGGGYLYLQQQLSIAHWPGEATFVEVPRGIGAREVVRLLKEQDIILDENVALAHLVLSGNRNLLKAGEYYFDRPLTTADVLDKLVSGGVYLHKFTVPEGLTITETAMKWQEHGFGPAEDFLAATREAVSSIHDLDPSAKTLEGYLFPETYSFPRKTTARQGVEAMIARFKYVIGQLKQSVPEQQWPRNLRETVILASLIETEAAHSDERTTISSVYLNRLERRMLLQCDPTVIYALELANKYQGRLTTADLRFDSPYNTYRYPGLPPSAIANPGYASLEAAVKPATTTYFYFVRTTGGRHTFSENLAAHNRAVAAYRALQRRAR